MNLVIKGADFSAVSIGKIDTTLSPAAKYGKVMLAYTGNLYAPDGDSTPSDYHVYVYDLTGIERVTIHSIGTSHGQATYSFHSGTCPTTSGDAVVDLYADDITAIRSQISLVGSPVIHSGLEEVVSENVEVPATANILMIYAGPSAYYWVKAKVEEVL